jgi:flagellar hook-associated protein 3 FlgL
MRISSLQIFNIADKNMARVNKSIIETQEQLSTGRRVLTPADDPVAATKILQITQDLEITAQYHKNIDIAENNLSLEEGALSSINSLLQRTQELAIRAANTATLSKDEYGILASEVDEQLKELLNLVNTKNANGDFIFGGYKTGNIPFDGDASSGFRYQGDEGQQFIKIANNTSVAATDSGKRAFLDVDSSRNTISTYAGNANRSSPQAKINIGRVIDQQEYDKFYPSDLVITFNPDDSITPAGKNFTVTERGSNRAIVENQRYSGGDEIVVQGVAVRISGSPTSGSPAEPARFDFGIEVGSVFPTVIAAPGESFTLRVGSKVETIVLSGNFNSTADIAAALNDVASGNADKLQNLGVIANNQGLAQINGINMQLANASVDVAGILGISQPLTGYSTSDGVTAVAGDRFYIDSSEKQDILTTLARFSEAMKSYDGSQESRDLLSDEIADTIANLNNAQTSVLDVTASIGARLNTLESTRSLHLDSELVSREILSSIRDLDYAEASTRLSQQTLILQATQQSFIRVSQLTLFAQL